LITAIPAHVRIKAHVLTSPMATCALVIQRNGKESIVQLVRISMKGLECY